MKKQSPKIDEYIIKAEDFAKPILLYLRDLIHETSDEISETTKWGFPHFEAHGAIVCSMASFKKHCSFGFWKASLMKDPKKLFNLENREGMGHLGNITKMEDLPEADVLKEYILEAVLLNKDGVKLPPKSKNAISPSAIAPPDDLLAKLNENPAARDAFTRFSPSHRKEYIEWINDAKTEATRTKRILTTVEWLTEGKGRHWKYER